jgi:hypothetical protein
VRSHISSSVVRARTCSSVAMGARLNLELPLMSREACVHFPSGSHVAGESKRIVHRAILYLAGARVPAVLRQPMNVPVLGSS